MMSFTWLKNGVVDLGFLSVSSAKDIPIEPLYKDPLLCVVPKGTPKRDPKEYMGIDEMRNHQFVTQKRIYGRRYTEFPKRK